MTSLEAIAETARIAYEDSRDARRAAEKREKTNYDAWMEARAAVGRENVHPLAGKAVKSVSVQTGRYRNVWDKTVQPDKIVTQRGIVTLCESDKQARRLRVYRPMVGEYYVASKSGYTAYKLSDAWQLDE